jgi:Uma2 family endonuclease
VAVAEIRRTRRFTAGDVFRMLETGILDGDEPLELLEGELVVLPPQSPEHATIVERIARTLEEALGSGGHARRHSSLDAGSENLPEPDVALVEGTTEDYLHRHPAGSDRLLVVEVASSSRAVDRRKAAIYARAGVPVYWLVDLVKRRLEVRSGPRPAGEYAQTRVLEPGDQAAIPDTDRTLSVADLLP